MAQHPVCNETPRPAGGALSAAGILFLSIALSTVASGAQPWRFALTPVAEERNMTVQIPNSIRKEHQEIHEALVRATQSKGDVGVRARELAKVLEPHFKREEEIALPPLGLLEPLSSGRPIPEAAAAEAMKMSEALRAELPRMLEEHKAIRAAVENLRAAARAASERETERLADALSLHALTEEEVLYPAAIVVGDALRTRQLKR